MQIDDGVMSYLQLQIDSCDKLLNQINIAIQRMRNKPVIFSGNPYDIHHQLIFLSFILLLLLLLFGCSSIVDRWP